MPAFHPADPHQLKRGTSQEVLLLRGGRAFAPQIDQERTLAQFLAREAGCELVSVLESVHQERVRILAEEQLERGLVPLLHRQILR